MSSPDPPNEEAFALSLKKRACFETTSRLLAQLINEGLCSVSVETHNSNQLHWLVLKPVSLLPQQDAESVRVAISSAVQIKLNENKQVTALVRANQLSPPVLLTKGNERQELVQPDLLFGAMSSWFGLGEQDERIRMLLEDQLRNGAANQVEWFKIAGKQSQLELASPSIAWERTLITGHPSHPLHRTCFAQAPLTPILPTEIPSLLAPEVIFLSLPRSAIRITGPFEELLEPLVSTLNIPAVDPSRIIIPTLGRQQPAISQRFPDAIPIGSVHGTAQASVRTITLSPKLNFPYHLKLSLACQITSALRTITPWSAIGAPEVSKMLRQLLPANLWVYGEVASATGAQDNFDDAKHLSCILRTDLEAQASEKGERLIMAAALAQPDPHDEERRTYAEVIFNLQSVEERLTWFQSYTSTLLNLVISPLIAHGIGLEAHGQNMCVRVCLQTSTVTGFAVRDFGGIRLHMPTLHSQGYSVGSIPAGSAIMTYNLKDVWNKVHHSLIQNHLGQLLVALGLEMEGGWAVVRECLRDVLGRDGNEVGKEVGEYFLREKMVLKCFMGMAMQGKYRDYVEREIDNVLLI